MWRMSQDDTAPIGAASSGERLSTPPSAGGRKAGPQRGGSVVFALLLAILAVGATEARPVVRDPDLDQRRTWEYQRVPTGRSTQHGTGTESANHLPEP